MIEKLDINVAVSKDTIVYAYQNREKINEIIDYLNPKEIEEELEKEKNRIENFSGVPNTLKRQTNNRIREEWEDKWRWDMSYQQESDLPKMISDWWLSKIDELLKSQREQRTKEIMEMIEKIDVSGGGNGRRLKQQILDELK